MSLEEEIRQLLKQAKGSISSTVGGQIPEHDRVGDLQRSDGAQNEALTRLARAIDELRGSA